MDHISLVGLDLGKRLEREEFRNRMAANVENAQNGASSNSLRAPICAELAQNRLEVAGIDLGSLGKKSSEFRTA